MTTLSPIFPIRCLLAIAVSALISLGCNKRPDNDSESTLPAPITFNTHVAPLVWSKCAGCHRPGQAAPFPLLTYAQVSKHAKLILDVTSSGYMPPWMPLRDGTFKGERHLTESELQTLRQWVERGAPEGSARLPPMPQWPDDWQLGKPDLVLETTKAYTLVAQGPDEYRNLVISPRLPRNRYVKAVEFRPETRSIHHAFIKIDKTAQSRALDGKDGAPGFPGIHGIDSAQMPEGQLLTWQPGKMPAASPQGCWWLLSTNMDFVLQLHLQRTGKAEEIRPRLGIYFAEEPPSRTPFKLHLVTYKFDIPPGATNYLVEDSMTVPCDIDVLRVLPHAHFLAARIEAEAVMPNGQSRPLITIPNWNFNWQGDYEYATPLFLPRNTIVRMRYIYDNSAANPRNPHTPPVHVRYGPASTNEMAELWLQTLARNPAERPALQEAQRVKDIQAFKEQSEMLISENPNDAEAQINLGFALLAAEKRPDALAHFEAAIRLAPNSDQAHYYRGVTLRMMERPAEALPEFLKVVSLNPNHGRAHGNLAALYAQFGDVPKAKFHVNETLRINPFDPVAQDLQKLLNQRP